MKQKTTPVEELKVLEKKLSDMRSTHHSAWDIYGSELCAGDMIRQEEELEKEIADLREEIEKNSEQPYYLEDPRQIIDN